MLPVYGRLKNDFYYTITLSYMGLYLSTNEFMRSILSFIYWDKSIRSWLKTKAKKWLKNNVSKSKEHWEMKYNWNIDY